MDTLSSPSLTTFQVHKPNHHHPNLKPPFSHHTAAAKTTATSSFLTLHQKDHFTPLNNLTYPKQKHPSSSSSFLQPPRASAYTFHRSAASGYAAALLNVSQCSDTVLKVEKDVNRLLKVLRNGQVMEFMMDENVNDIVKGEVVKEMLDKGKFDKGFVVLVKLVVDKGKNDVEFVKQVLEEFLRLFTLLSNKLAFGNGK